MIRTCRFWEKGATKGGLPNGGARQWGVPGDPRGGNGWDRQRDTWYSAFVARSVRIWTWDRGNRPVNMDGSPELLVPILETVLNGALWRELKKFPPDTLKRLLPRVDVAPNIRRLVEIWIEEKHQPVA